MLSLMEDIKIILLEDIKVIMKLHFKYRGELVLETI